MLLSSLTDEEELLVRLRQLSISFVLTIKATGREAMFYDSKNYIWYLSHIIRQQFVCADVGYYAKSPTLGSIS